MYNFEINTDLKLIHYSHSGMIPLEELGEAWKELLQINEFVNLDYNLLSDYRNGDFNFQVLEVDMIWEFLESIKHILNGKKEAVITDKPFSTAISILFEHKILLKIGFNVKVFSTEEAALLWLASFK